MIKRNGQRIAAIAMAVAIMGQSIQPIFAMEKEEIPSKNYIFTGSKGLFKGDIQIDDLLSNLQATSSPTKILFPSYHNKEISEETLIENGVIMPTRDWRRGWEEIEKILLKRLEMRKNHE